MLNKYTFSLFLFVAGISAVCMASNKRSEGFFGLHLDFHAVKENDRIGENVTEEMVQQIINEIKPDYIQVDSKGHPGYSSYPTKVGQRTDGYVGDPLKIWRKVTKANNIPLVVHYSTLYEIAAIRKNSEWGYMKYDGSRDKNYASLFSPIAQELLIPQIKELRSEYGVDAIWLDGECWAVGVDYCPDAKALFKSKYGDIKIPAGPEDELYFEYLEMLRQKYREFLARYLEEIHRFDEDFEVASNWAFSSLMPEKCTLDVDWISGDLPSSDSVNSARLEARCMRYHKKNWDLMSWGFFNGKGSLINTKTPIQLKQEAASVISQGGGFQVYYTQLTNGSVRLWQIDNLIDVAKFCRERQPYCQNSRPVTQTAVLFSTEALYRMGASDKRVWGPWGDSMSAMGGIGEALCDSQVAFDFMMEYQILENLDKLELIIIPEWSWIDKEFKKQLVSFVNNGGNLLVIGAQSTKLFRSQLGVSFASEIQNGNRWLAFDNNYASYMKNDFVSIQAPDGVKTIGMISPFELTGYMSRDGILASNAETPAATINKLGKGFVAGIYLNIGKNYVLAGNCYSRDFLKKVVDELLPQPIVKVEGSHHVDVTVNKVRGNLAINLVNTAGPHGSNTVHVFDEIPSVGPLKVSIKTCRKPKSIMMQPVNIRLEYLQSGVYSVVTVPKLELHQILIVE